CDAPGRNNAGYEFEPERPGNTDRDKLRVRQRRQLDDPDPIGKLRQQLSRDFDGESRLANASRASKGNEPIVGQEPDHFLNRDLAADQIRYRCRKICRSARRTGNFRRRPRLRPLALAGRASANFAPELVASTDDGPNKAVVRESLAQSLYLGVQIVLF